MRGFSTSWLHTHDRPANRPCHVPSSDQHARDPVEELAEQFLQRYRLGEMPAISEFTALAPDHAEEIKELFPALVLMEQADLAPTPPPSRPPLCLEHLGDYRIIREVGRGGMGVVYEAIQETLNRHVALKVLPGNIAGDSHSLLRFRREARSAARLHHTNIVPVFEIGEREGLHYYAMQFIQGQGLHEVIVELRKLRQLPGTLSLDQRIGEQRVHLAESLVTGKFHAEKEGNFSTPEVSKLPAVAADHHNALDSEPSSLSLSDPSGLASKSDYQFYRSVARLGLQVADALAYAHSQRVLHRDIKPANLILDVQGTVWVTDFGLAKEEGHDLTRTGDVVGTLRYMAPERFKGISDARSDLYSLGLTIYEVLTLQPAFNQSDRARLVRAVIHEMPPRPKKLDPHLPRDLETIILKAIAKEPDARYQSAEEMKEDLWRFLSDRPIRARQASRWERSWRWCRRNPGWAAMLALLTTLLVCILIGSAVFNFHLQIALTNAKNADLEKTEKLWQAHLERARALRTSGRIGQRFAALQAIREASQIKMTRELRDEAVAALALPDVELDREWIGLPEDILSFAHDDRFHRVACLTKNGQLIIHELSTSGLHRLYDLPAAGTTVNSTITMSPDGRFLAFAHSSATTGIPGKVRIWRLEQDQGVVFAEDARDMRLFAISFHPNKQLLAIGHNDGTISFFDLTSKTPTRTVLLKEHPNSLAFHPQDAVLAVSSHSAIRIVDIHAQTVQVMLRDPKVRDWSYGLAWHPQGRILAAASEDTKIYLWDVPTGALWIPPLQGHSNTGIHMAFNHQGDRLLSHGWDDQTCLWDLTQGSILLNLPGRFGSRFSADDSHLGLSVEGQKLRLWRIADGRELRKFRRRGADPQELILYPVLHESSRILVAGSTRGLVFFDIDTGKELAFVPLLTKFMRYPQKELPDGWLIVGNRETMFWPIQQDISSPGRFKIGPPARLGSASNAGVDVTPDGRKVVMPQGDLALLLDRKNPREAVELTPHHDIRYCAISPDGKYVASCSWFIDDAIWSVRIWSGENGNQITDLPLRGHSMAQFSPDGRWLATVASKAYQLWEVGAWRSVRTMPSFTCWSHDGRWLAESDRTGSIRFVTPEMGNEVFRVTGPDAKSYSATSLSTDGRYVIATTGNYQAIYVWDLELIGAGLKVMGLAQDWPFPARAAQPARPPITVHVDPGLVEDVRYENAQAGLAAGGLAIALQPLHPEAYLQRGLLRIRERQTADAIADLEMFLKLTSAADSRRPEVLRQLAAVCNEIAWDLVKAPLSTGQSALGLQAARRAVEIDPNDFMYQNTLGVALYRTGRYAEAIKCLNANLKISKHYGPFDLYFLAMSYYRNDQKELAQACMAKARQALAAETKLSSGHLQELDEIRAEAEKVMGTERANQRP